MSVFTKAKLFYKNQQTLNINIFFDFNDEVITLVPNNHHRYLFFNEDELLTLQFTHENTLYKTGILFRDIKFIDKKFYYLFTVIYIQNDQEPFFDINYDVTSLDFPKNSLPVKQAEILCINDKSIFLLSSVPINDSFICIELKRYLELKIIEGIPLTCQKIGQNFLYTFSIF